MESNMTGNAARVAVERSGSCPISKSQSEIGHRTSDIRHPKSDGCAFDEDLADFESNMNIETLHIGMKVRHPQSGVGVVKSLTEQPRRSHLTTRSGQLRRRLAISNRRKRPQL
jgi:hypothetical protein